MMKGCELLWRSRMLMGAVAAVLVMVVFTAPAFSHGPADVVLNYDLGKQTLSVTVTHSPFSEGHYLKEIEVGKNGKSVGKYSYTAQPGEKFTYTYKIPAQPGDVLEAKATCSKYGSKTGKLVIPKLM